MGMQDSPVAITANNQVKFSATLNGTYRTRANIASSEVQNMRYALCTLSESVSTLILQVANMIPGQSIPSATTILASAVASREPSKSNCALPIAICQAGAAPDSGWCGACARLLKPSRTSSPSKWIGIRLRANRILRPSRRPGPCGASRLRIACVAPGQYRFLRRGK